MATERLPMRTIREILRQKWQLGRSNRAVARSVGLSVSAIGGTFAPGAGGGARYLGGRRGDGGRRPGSPALPAA